MGLVRFGFAAGMCGGKAEAAPRRTFRAEASYLPISTGSVAGFQYLGVHHWLICWPTSIGGDALVSETTPVVHWRIGRHRLADRHNHLLLNLHHCCRLPGKPRISLLEVRHQRTHDAYYHT